MKILLTIHETLDPNSGSVGSTLMLGQQYQKLGHEVQYYSKDNLPGKLSAPVKRMIFPEFVAARIAKLSNQQAIDVVDASTGDAWIWAKLLRNSRRKCPILATRSHGLDHLEHDEIIQSARRGDSHLGWKYWLYRGSLQLWEASISIRYADLVFVLNRREAEYVTEKLGVKPERVHVFPNGIPEAFLNQPFEPLIDNPSAICIAQVSTYIPRKGIQYSVPALNRILARYPQVKMSFLGTECRECPDVAQIYADFNPSVRDRIEVIPRFAHEKLPTLLRGHHIKLLPSISEGFGKALIEAMACGLAPVTTATPGPREIVRHEHDGLIVPPRDSQAIEQALERLITDCSYLEQLRRNAYTTAQRYSWQHIAINRLFLYEKALRQREDAHAAINI